MACVRVSKSNGESFSFLARGVSRALAGSEGTSTVNRVRDGEVEDLSVRGASLSPCCSCGSQRSHPVGPGTDGERRKILLAGNQLLAIRDS